MPFRFLDLNPEGETVIIEKLSPSKWKRVSTSEGVSFWRTKQAARLGFDPSDKTNLAALLYQSGVPFNEIP